MAYLADEFINEGHLEIISGRTGLSLPECLGRIIFLWHKSQKARIRKSDTTTISSLLLFCPQDKKRGVFLDAMISTGLLIADGNELEIAGNSKRIELLDRRRETGSMGGKAAALVKQCRSSSIASATASADVLLQGGCTPTPTPTPEEKNITKKAGDAFSAENDLPAASQIHELWNSIAGSDKQISRITAKRREHLRARLKEQPEIEYWRGVFETFFDDMSWSAGKSWATFDWLIKNDTNHVKVSEGAYLPTTEELATQDKHKR